MLRIDDSDNEFQEQQRLHEQKNDDPFPRHRPQQQQPQQRQNRVRINISGGTEDENFSAAYAIAVSTEKCCCCFPLKCGCYCIFIFSLIGALFECIHYSLLLSQLLYTPISIILICISGLSIFFLSLGLIGIRFANAAYILIGILYLLFSAIVDCLVVIVNSIWDFDNFSLVDILTVMLFFAIDLYFVFVLYKLYVIVCNLRGIHVRGRGGGQLFQLLNNEQQNQLP